MMISDTAVRNAKPRTKQYKMFDGDGLYLLVKPTGHKYWRFKYRFNKSEKLLAFGTYPEITLKEARDRRLEARRLIAHGIDPAEKKKEEKLLAAYKAGTTFAFVAEEWFNTNKATWTPEHAERLWRRLALHMIPEIGKRPMPPPPFSVQAMISCLGRQSDLIAWHSTFE